MNKSSVIYIAGHRGLVGSAILRRLQSVGYTKFLIRTHKEFDLEIQKDVYSFFENERPEYVFLAAAKVGGIIANNTYPADFIYNNLIIQVNIIHASYKFGVKKLVFLGSSCIYPKFSPQPIKEEYLLTGKLESTNEPYAVAKIAGIKMCQSYNRQYGTNFISVMPTNLYGPNDNFDLTTSHVLPALIRKFHLAKLLKCGRFDDILTDLKIHGNPFNFNQSSQITDRTKNIIDYLSSFGISKNSLTLWGSGEPYREFLYIDDLANACVFIMENLNYKDIGECINIGSGVEIKIKDLAQLIKKIVGFDGKILYDRTKPDGTPRKTLDISKIRTLGWKPKTGLETGIKEYYDFYLERAGQQLIQ